MSNSELNPPKVAGIASKSPVSVRPLRVTILSDTVMSVASVSPRFSKKIVYLTT